VRETGGEERLRRKLTLWRVLGIENAHIHTVMLFICTVINSINITTNFILHSIRTFNIQRYTGQDSCSQ
jgi:hypothetical protein